jgi:basic membrane protein A
MAMDLGRRVTALLLLSVAFACTAGCKKKRAATEKGEQAAEVDPDAGKFVVGFVYSGPRDDQGFNQAHAAGAAAVAALPGVKVIEVPDAPELEGSDKAVEGLIGLRNASLVFATAWGQFHSAVLPMATKHPKVQLLHCGGYYREGADPANAGSYHGYLDEAFYVAGVAAGMTTRTRKLGFVAAKPLPHVLRAINAFTLGARSVNARVTSEVRFTDSWSDARLEAAAAEALIANKVDVLAAYVNAPRTVLETAERSGIYSVGVHVDGAAHAPKGHLTSAVWDWRKLYVDYVNWVRDGKNFPRVIRGGLRDGYVTVTPFGPAVSEQARNKAVEASVKLAEGKLVIFTGPLKDNRRREVIPAGTQVIPRDAKLEQVSYLLEGIVGDLARE